MTKFFVTHEINDIDSTNDGYDTDSVIYLDDNGNIIKAPFKQEVN